MWFRSVYSPNRDALDKPLLMSSRVKPPPMLTLTTDASLIGRGAHLNNHKVQGKRSPSEVVLHINLLELRAVRNACVRFLPFIRDTHTKVMMDNVTCMFCTKWAPDHSPFVQKHYNFLIGAHLSCLLAMDTECDC